MKYLEQFCDSVRDIYSLLSPLGIESALDGGAYSGDTLREMREQLPTLRRAIAVEPDRRTFKKLLAYAEFVDDFSIEPHNAALWSSLGEAAFSSSANRNSTVTATASYEHRTDEIPLVTVDSLVTERVDYIKYDVEGAEREALEGSLLTVGKYSPALRIAIYHRSRDIFSIINYMKGKTDGYEFYVRRTRCTPAWELDLLMIPRKDKKL